MPLRRIFIGDVQGCREELEDLLATLNFDSAHDELHPVGDLVNRGPDNVGTLRLLRRVSARGVLGNHDLHLLRVAAGKRRLSASDTIQDVLDAPDRAELLQWLGHRPFVEVWDDVVCVHAGLNPVWDDPRRVLVASDPLELDEAAEFATLVRYCDPRGRRPEHEDEPVPPPPPYRPWFEHPRSPGVGNRTVVYGHWAAMGLVLRPALRGLDSGCVWGDALTAWIAEENRIVQVPSRQPRRIGD